MTLMTLQHVLIEAPWLPWALLVATTLAAAVGGWWGRGARDRWRWNRIITRNCFVRVPFDAQRSTSAQPAGADDRGDRCENEAQSNGFVHTLRSAIRSLPHRQRKAVVCAGIACVAGGMTCDIMIGELAWAFSASAQDAAACDDTMFIAAHPQLANGSDSSPEALARRFVILMREVSPSWPCNYRSVREALQLASSDVMREFAKDVKFNGVQRFMDRRHTEVVSVEQLSVVARSSTVWDLQWVEHVRSPAGADLRTDHYAAELHTSSRNRPPLLEVSDFQPRTVATTPSGASR